MQYQKIYRTAAIMMILILSVVILVYAKPFLVPLTFAALLAMLLLPVVNWLQRRGWNRVMATVSSILLLVLFFVAVFYFISTQLSDIAGNTSKIEQQVSKKYRELQHTVSEKLGIPPDKQNKMMQEQQSAAPGRMASMITGFLSGVGSLLTNIILVLVYIFLFTYFRGRLKNFIIKLIPKKDEANALTILNSTQKVTQKYLSGLSLMIVCLWIMYGIGFSIVGVQNAFFFAILCGMLELVPFVGNLTGTALTVAMSLVQGGGSEMVIGILVTYGIVQFIQTYILEPLVVGSEVNINPLFTIVGLVAGELLWGIPGMILAIPLLGIAKIVFDHIEVLKPYGYLIGQDKKKKESGMVEKVKNIFNKGAKK
jgi:predicted PurR-regulated permease PerM